MRAPGLDEAEMPRRDRRSQGELELAEVAPLPSLPKQRPCGRWTRGEVHVVTLATGLPMRDQRDRIRRLTSQVIDKRTRGGHARTRPIHDLRANSDVQRWQPVNAKPGSRNSSQPAG